MLLHYLITWSTPEPPGWSTPEGRPPPNKIDPPVFPLAS